MWILVFLLDLLGRKNFLRVAFAWLILMGLFFYCFVHEAFDGGVAAQRVNAPHRTAAPGR